MQLDPFASELTICVRSVNYHVRYVSIPAVYTTTSFYNLVFRHLLERKL